MRAAVRVDCVRAAAIRVHVSIAQRDITRHVSVVRPPACAG